MEEEKDKAWKLLIESLNHSTEESHELRQREIKNLQTILDLEKKITLLIEKFAEKQYQQKVNE